MEGKPCEVLMFTEELQIVDMTDFGLSTEAIMSGEAEMPPLGLRIDGELRGTVSGPGLEGTMTSIDYALLQADGTYKIHAHAVITTEDGARISVLAEGLGRPQAGSMVFKLRQMQTLQTAEEDYAWVNDKRFWAIGEGNMQTGKVVLDVYAMAEELETS